MRVLLRSTLVVKIADPSELFLQNILALDTSGLVPDVPEEKTLWRLIRDFAKLHQHAPDFKTIQLQIQAASDLASLDYLELVIRETPKTRGDFQVYLERKIEERRSGALLEALRVARAIATTGLEVDGGEHNKKQMLRGVDASLGRLRENLREVERAPTGIVISGGATGAEAAAASQAEYEHAKISPVVGNLTCLMHMDTTLRGTKNKELHVHAAFSSHLKSTFAANWAYNLAVIYQRSVLYFSLEMNYEQVRRQINAMHSYHYKFRDIRFRLGLQADEEADVGLEYDKIRDGKLSQAEEEFYLNHVLPDLKDEANAYGNIHIEVADPDKANFTVPHMQAVAEAKYAQDPFVKIFVDHGGIVDSEHHYSSTTDRLNEVMKNLKKLARGFRRGQGMDITALFQIGREGYRAALKKKEAGRLPRYQMFDLSYANEAERCVPYNFFVKCYSGYKNIGSVSEGDLVWSSTGWRKVLNRFDNGVRPLWKLETDRGSTFEATAPHRIRVVLDGEIGWKAMRDLTPQDFVASAFGGDSWPTQAFSLPSLEFRRNETSIGRGKGGMELDTPDAVNLDLAYLLGAWDGDGKVHPKGVAWTGNRKEAVVRDRIRDAFEECFGHPLPLQESPSRPGSFDLVKWSQPLKRWFEGVAGKRAGEVPECILRSPRNQVCAYLRGLFDTDGWINTQGQVGLHMKRACEPFLRDVQMLLTALGIDSDLSFRNTTLKKTGKTYGGVVLRVRTWEGLQQYAHLIGFTGPEKQNRLQHFLLERGKERRKDAQTYPTPQTFLRLYEAVKVARGQEAWRGRSAQRPGFWHLGSKVRQSGIVSRGAVMQVLALAEEYGIAGPEVDFFRHLLTLQVMRVRKVEDAGRSEPVMDLEVEGDHEYQTGPVLSHNSADIITTSWVDEELRAQNLVMFDCLKSRDQAPFAPFHATVKFPCRRILTGPPGFLQDAKVEEGPKKLGGRKSGINPGASVADVFSVIK